MSSENPLFRKVTIVGVGLIGGSIGLALKKHRLASHIVGLTHGHESLAYAQKTNAIDEGSHDIKRAVNDADLIIFATPVKTIINLLPVIAGSVKRGCIVTDVGSTKAAIVEVAEKYLTSAFFVGGHPLAGSEKQGAMFAQAELFQNALWVLTPTEKTNRGALEKVQSLWSQLGAVVKTLSPQEHDRILSFVSHLPHVVAYALISSIPQEYLAYAATGLKDTTRIAASPPSMWNDICVVNSKNVMEALDEFIRVLSSLRKMIVAHDEQGLSEHFKKAKSKRDGIS